MQSVAKEATWWGGEKSDFWNSECQMCKHGKRVMENELVFVIYQEMGKTYFLKEAKSISDKNVRAKEIERSKKFLCEELAKKTTCKLVTIIEKNPACNAATEEKKEEVIQPKGASGHIPEVRPESENLLYSMKGSGQPLSDSPRAFFEPRFGQDFSGVRVHTDGKAEEAARAVDARAYTAGKDVVFGKGEYVPGTIEGQRLMAHELTHVMQQGRKPYSAIAELNAVSEPKDFLERQEAQPQPTTESTNPEVSLEEVLSWTEKLSNLPYGFHADDTCKMIYKKKGDLKIAIKDLEKKSKKKDLSKASPQEKQEWEKVEQDLKDSQNRLLELEGPLQGAIEAYWNKSLKELVTKKLGKASPEIINAIRKYGIVCNTYVEVVMRMSGFADFPLMDLPYTPKSEKFKKKEEENIKRDKKLRSSWGLGWDERMVDWALSNGKVVYDDEDPANKTLPSEPKVGDIVIFGTASKATHVNLVVANNGKFNFIGGKSPGKYSGKALGTPFEKYDDKLPTKEGQQDIPQIMQQEKYLWILRPGYRQPESKPSEAAPEKEG